jgi:uncharacterized membrane protein
VQENFALRRTYDHDSVEFARALTFTDGLFAIAMTLLVVGLTVPTLADHDSVGQLADALHDDQTKFISFAISFAVIGRYWLAHHSYFSALRAINRNLIALNLVYLAFIAFLPFPTALIGEFFDNPLALTIYALNVAIVSGMEVVLFTYAYKHDLLERRIPRDVYRYGAAMSLAPVVFFVISIPIAFLTTTTVAAFTWFLGIPLSVVAQRWKPAGADEFLLG